MRFLKETNLILTNHESTTYKTTDIIKGKVFKILVKRNLGDKYFTYLSDLGGNILFKNLSKTGKINIFYSDNGNNYKQLKLDDKLAIRLGEYIRDNNNIKNKNFECSSFIHFLSGAPIRDKGIVLDLNMWKNKKITKEEKLKIGDAILLGEINEENMNNGNYHWAMHIGENLFINKYLNMDGFVITDLKALLESENTEIINLMNPNFERNYTHKLIEYINKNTED